MSPFLFWFFAALMLVFGTIAVLNRNPVASALSLVVSFLGLSALFFGLNAEFIGVIQILVYAGAVMVLFLFIIMLLDLKAENRRTFSVPAIVGGLVIVALFVVQLVLVIRSFAPGTKPFPPLGSSITVSGSAFHSMTAYSNKMFLATDASNIGNTLFGHYNLPFQVIGVLILVASIGVVVLSKRELK